VQRKSLKKQSISFSLRGLRVLRGENLFLKNYSVPRSSLSARLAPEKKSHKNVAVWLAPGKTATPIWSHGQVLRPLSAAGAG
jgi:hypothetical protein